MPYTWNFTTSGRTINPLGQRCHVGPMADFEITMAAPFKTLRQIEPLRVRTLNAIVNSEDSAVRTREVTLRTITSLLSPIFSRLMNRKEELQVLICDKRSCVDIEKELSDLTVAFLAILPIFKNYAVPEGQLELIYDAIKSDSPVVVVAGKSAVILLAALIEMDLQNGHIFRS